MKIVFVPVNVGCIYGALYRLFEATTIDGGLVASKNQVDEAAFSRTCFTENDDIGSGLLDNPVRFITDEFRKWLVLDCHFV